MPSTKKISTILDRIDSGHLALPEFQRGYVWSGEQVRKLFASLYHEHPVGSFLVWSPGMDNVTHRGNAALASGADMLLDGQQRVTTLYGVIRGKKPPFFDGDSKPFTGLWFHLERQDFGFYQVKMRDDPLWVDVTDLMQKGNFGSYITRFHTTSELATKVDVYSERLNKLLNIPKREIYLDEITGTDNSLEVVVDIFNQINSGGTKLSKGDLALANICSRWPEARKVMNENLQNWKLQGYNFKMDWFLRSVNTVLTGEAKFHFLHKTDAQEVINGVELTTKHINTCLNKISDRLGLDYDQVLFGRFAIPVMVRYLKQEQQLDSKTWDKLLFWYAQAGMWGRFSGSTETAIDKELEAIEDTSNGLDALLEQLRKWRGGLKAEPGHFSGWSQGARFFPVLYLLTRMGAAQDWGTGVALKANLLGKMSRLEVHHIFPKSKLYQHERGYVRSEVNALGNYCFLTKETNLNISATLPEEYFPKVEAAHPGVLASQWIPQDEKLWKIENYRGFLEARQILLAQELERRMRELLHGDDRWLDGPSSPVDEPIVLQASTDAGEEKDVQLEAVNAWMQKQQLPEGLLFFELLDSSSGKPQAELDLAWPNGIHEGYSNPVAVMLNAPATALTLADQAGFRCFTSIQDFRKYVEIDIKK